MSFSIGYKNGICGSLEIAIDAIQAASSPHTFLGVTKQGMAAVTRTTGNQHGLVILRGSDEGPNYEKKHIIRARQALKQKGQRENLMVDCSHANSGKNFRNQPLVAMNVAGQIASGENAIVGVMIESNLNEGSQTVPAKGVSALKPGISITDACVSWETTATLLELLSNAVQCRRMGLQAPTGDEVENSLAKLEKQPMRINAL